MTRATFTASSRKGIHDLWYTELTISCDPPHYFTAARTSVRDGQVSDEWIAASHVETVRRWLGNGPLSREVMRKAGWID